MYNSNFNFLKLLKFQMFWLQIEKLNYSYIMYTYDSRSNDKTTVAHCIHQKQNKWLL